jgi:predicted dehydrogenase
MALADHRVLVAGCGSIGRRHLRNLRALGVKQLAACDPDAGRAGAAAEETGAAAFASLGEGLAAVRPDAVLICTPPVLHVSQARAAVSAGAHVFVEKPLSDSLEGLDELAAALRASKRICQVGYNLRFDAGLRRLRDVVAEGRIGRVLWARAEYGQFLPDWRPGRDYRETYSARKGQGGGVLLDVSHELDSMLWILGRPTAMTWLAGRVSRLDVDVDDCATVLLRFESGAQADVHVDFVQRAYSRTCKVAGELGTVEWHFADREVRTFDAARNAWETWAYGGEANDMYVAELRHFLECVESGSEPDVDLAQGRRVLEIALRAGGAAVGEEPVAR